MRAKFYSVANDHKTVTVHFKDYVDFPKYPHSGNFAVNQEHSGVTFYYRDIIGDDVSLYVPNDNIEKIVSVRHNLKRDLSEESEQ